MNKRQLLKHIKKSLTNRTNYHYKWGFPDVSIDVLTLSLKKSYTPPKGVKQVVVYIQAFDPNPYASTVEYSIETYTYKEYYTYFIKNNQKGIGHKNKVLSYDIFTDYDIVENEQGYDKWVFKDNELLSVTESGLLFTDFMAEDEQMLELYQQYREKEVTIVLLGGNNHVRPV